MGGVPAAGLLHLLCWTGRPRRGAKQREINASRGHRRPFTPRRQTYPATALQGAREAHSAPTPPPRYRRRGQTFLNAVTRTMRTTGNTGMTCNLTRSSEVVQREPRGGMTCHFTQLGERDTGGRPRADVHLDRDRPRSASTRGACLGGIAVKYPRLLPPVVLAV